MASKTTSLGINGGGRRKLPSWIDHFVTHTGFLGSPKLFRKWTAIATIAAVVERKVWMESKGRLYPNLYTILVGAPGVGKTITIDTMLAMIREGVPDLHLSPTSMSKAALVDCLEESKRDHFWPGHEIEQWRSMFIAVDELSAFMAKWDDDLAAALTKFYDCNFYGEARRIGTIRITIEKPQINVLCGTTPTFLMESFPHIVWGQGLMSRIILVNAENHEKTNALDGRNAAPPKDLIHDLTILGSIQGGQMEWDQEFYDTHWAWVQAGERPKPTNPRLAEYCSRRVTHLFKLSMIACIDEGQGFILGLRHWERAQAWLFEAEANMPAIFTGTLTVDARNQEDLLDWVKRRGGATDPQLTHEAARRVPLNTVRNLIEIMQLSGRIKKRDGKWQATD